MTVGHYDGDAVRRSVGHFALGKLVTAASAIVLLVLLARVLPKGDYAAYVTLQALVLIIGAVTSFGVNQSVLRYLPEMRALGHNKALYGLLWRTIASRVVVIGLGFLLCGLALPWLAQWFGLDAQKAWVQLYFVVGLMRLVGYFVSTAMETLLWPRISQYALALSAGIKLLVVSVLVWQGQLDFPALVIVEACTEAIALCALLGGLRHAQRRDPLRSAGDPTWAVTNRARMRNFGRWNYLTTVLTQLSTSAPYRMLAAAALTAESTAQLGLVLSLGDMLHRFLPARMGLFVLRSVLVARASTGMPAHGVLEQLNLNFRINAALITLFSTCALAAGSGAIATVTAGHYVNTGPLLAAVGGVLMLNLWRMQFDLLASIYERVAWSVLSNSGLIVGLPLAWMAAPQGAAWAILAAWATGQGVAIGVYAIGLRRQGASRLADWRSALFFASNLALVLMLDAVWPAAPWTFKLVVALMGLVSLAFLLRPVRYDDVRRWRRPAARNVEGANP